jgi:UDP-2,3-diacylglucosamine pyrophosphatase LpxH
MPINSDSRIVIFSDLHLGNRRSRDDFKKNSEMIMAILKRHYLAKDFHLILNGDVEEMMRVHLEKIQRKWGDLYAIFRRFTEKGRFTRIVGNHDIDFALRKADATGEAALDGLVLMYGDKPLFVFHGHQASIYQGRIITLSRIFLKYVANPLWIKNLSLSHDNTRIHRTERLIYEFARKRNLIAVIGHTHRPLFESLSEYDFVRFKIEYLLREYPKVSEEEQARIEHLVLKYRDELLLLREEENAFGKRSSLYDQDIVIPSIFNSGCVMGKRGITGLEISDGTIALVHWFDRRRGRKHAPYAATYPTRLEGTSYCRMVLKQDFLDYIFTRIRLLS